MSALSHTICLALGMAVILAAPVCHAQDADAGRPTAAHLELNRHPGYEEPGWDRSELSPTFHATKSRLAVTYGLQDADVPLSTRVAVAEAFPTLKPYEQAMLLKEPLWSKVKCAGFVKVLTPWLVLPSWPETNNVVTFLDLVVVRLIELQSDDARQFIIEDIKRPRLLLSLKALLCLPEAAMPELDAAFLSHLTRTTDLYKVAPVITRYGSPDLLAPVKNLCVQHEGNWACLIHTSLLQYWIKHEPAEGINALIRAMNLREKTGCFASIISATVPAVYSEKVEEAILPFLNDADIQVVIDTALTIGRYGTSRGRERIIEMIKSTPPASVDTSASDSRRNIRGNLIGSLSYRRTPVPDEKDIEVLKPILTVKEWNDMLQDMASWRTLVPAP